MPPSKSCIPPASLTTGDNVKTPSLSRNSIRAGASAQEQIAGNVYLDEVAAAARVAAERTAVPIGN
jgi:hypothetical protein